MWTLFEQFGFEYRDEDPDFGSGLTHDRDSGLRFMQVKLDAVGM